MTPITFHNRFGWLHEASGSTGVLLCGAQGYEQLCAQKAWRLLGDRIAQSGFPVLRFDYGGAGDSLGSDRDPDRLDDWLASTRMAIAELKERTGVDRVILLGLRLGASLAAQVASEDGDVAGLALLAPVASGRAYVRELSVLVKMQAQAVTRPADVPEEPGLEVQGFWLSPQTQESLRAVDLTKLQKAPAPKVLLVAPDEHTSAESVASHLEGLGCEVQRAPFVQYAQFIAEPTFSRLPEEAIASVTQWLETHFADGANTAPAPVIAEEDVITGAHFIEEPISFGPGRALFGMLCMPKAPAPGAPTLVYVNAGANPHIGWARMTVDNARAFAAMGVSSFRMDVAGLGDSAPIPGRKSQIMYSLETIEDVKAALDLLAARGYCNFHMVGLCSGAHLAFHTAVADTRIQGLVMANLQKFIWQDGYSLEIAVRSTYRSNTFYKGQALRAETWRRLLRGEIDVLGIARAVSQRLLRLVMARGEALAGALNIGPPNDVTKVKRGFRAVSGRGGRFLLVYSSTDGGLDEIAQYMGAGGKQVEALPGSRFAIIEGGDHNLTPRWARDAMLGHMRDFLLPSA